MTSRRGEQVAATGPAGHARSAGPSIEQRLIDAGMRPSGFDYMRLALAISVIFFHSLEFSSRTPALWVLTHRPFNVWDVSVVPMFFVLSGFLVAGSLDRTRSLLDFVGLRVLRIFPALAVDTLFSAAILGAALTSLPLDAYWRSPMFHSYFMNMFGDIHYALPGVFGGNPYSFVNIQLWTIPYEFGCYLMLLGLRLAGIYRRRAVFLAVALLVIVSFKHWLPILSITDRRHGLVAPSFLAGVAMHLYRDRIPWNGFIFSISILAMGIAAALPDLLQYLPIPLAYATVFLGTFNPKKMWVIRSGDYSYGMYLYGFPVAQALIATLPVARLWYGDFVLTTLATGGLALLSWRLVEKPCLALKPRLFAFNARLLTFRPQAMVRQTGG